ncbi:MAG: acetyl-CoA carboxylase biotin carboxyl carrier protein [Lachnospiraceae bacterium]|nr:acetyl-CoA carboxylase biotin carboxyl carrier protein [Lachnospiraceae bacterium]
MNIQDVYALLDRFEASAMTELSLEMEGMKVSCSKFNGEAVTYTNAGTQSVSGQNRPDNTRIEKNTVPQNQNTQTKADSQEQNASLLEIKAPIVGTFYRSAAPDQEPFVQVGDTVKKGDVVGMIEAMKMMNEIAAPFDGVITSIAAENEKLVSFGEVLMLGESQ